jgi:hypothetical protein
MYGQSKFDRAITTCDAITIAATYNASIAARHEGAIYAICHSQY